MNFMSEYLLISRRTGINYYQFRRGCQILKERSWDLVMIVVGMDMVLVVVMVQMLAVGGAVETGWLIGYVQNTGGVNGPCMPRC